MTGTLAERGVYERWGFDQAIKDINEGGGIKSLGGALVNGIVTDAGSTTDAAVSAYKRLSSSYSLSGCVGLSASALALAVTEQCEKDKIPFLTGALADILTGRGYNYTFNTSPTASVFGVTVYNMARGIAQVKGVAFNNIAIVGQNAPSDIATGNTWENMVKADNLTLAMRELTEIGWKDATSVVLKLKAANPDVLFLVFSSSTDLVVLLDKMNELDFHPKVGPIMSGDPVTFPSVGESLGYKTAGLTAAVYTWQYKDNPITQHLLNVTGAPDFVPAIMISTYGQVMLIKEAMEIAGSADPVKVRDALSSLYITSGPAWVWPSVSPNRAIHFQVDGRRANSTCVMVQWQNSTATPPKPAGYVIFPVEFATRDPL
jgi:branched-chain amino acid transport system substrate-binding protein